MMRPAQGSEGQTGDVDGLQRERLRALGLPALEGTDVHEIFDDLEVLDVVGDELCSVGYRGRGDREVSGALAGLTTPLPHSRFQPTPLSGHSVIHRQRIWEASLDQAQARRPLGSSLIVRCNEQPEVQLGDRDGADR